jgi:hypothetical protein
MVGDVVGTGSAVGDGVGHGFLGSSGKQGVGTGVTVGEADGDGEGVGVCCAAALSNGSRLLATIPNPAKMKHPNRTTYKKVFSILISLLDDGGIGSPNPSWIGFKLHFNAFCQK